MCLVRISEQTASLALCIINTLVLYNRGGQCLLCGTHRVLEYYIYVSSLKGVSSITRL